MAKTRIDNLAGGPARVPPVLIPAAVLILVVAAGGCAGKAPPQQLAQACEVKQCTCVDSSVAWWRKAATSEPLWSAGGRAYCPEGQELRLAETKR
jgi:hypothetical protein